MENAYLYFVILPVYALSLLALAMTFKKAGVAWWKALVPVLNIVEVNKLTGRPVWRTILFFIPVINFIMMVQAILDLARSFGRHGFFDHLCAVVVPYLYFLYIGFSKNVKYAGKWKDMMAEYHEKHKKRELREWADAILFAGASAVLIRTYMIEAFMIPTTSMEGTLKAGDFLFVSKMSYGVRMPMIPLAMPFVHNSLPLMPGVKSYSSWPQLPYFRTPGFGKVERNDAVVFNYPDDDEHPDVPILGPVPETPMKQNYIKRCVGIPGDSLQVKSGVLYVNGKPAWRHPKAQQGYDVIDSLGALRLKTKPLQKLGFRLDLLADYKWNLSKFAQEINNKQVNPDSYANDDFKPGGRFSNSYEVYASDERIAKLKEQFPSLDIRPRIETEVQDGHEIDPKYKIFPKELKQFPWTNDNFGPIYIPQKGKTVAINRKVLPLYRKIIEVYEGHELRLADGAIYIDGKVATEYTFEKDYYWMMGDNRDASLDARYFGYTPEDHIIGKPILVLFSWDGGPVWERFFRGPAAWEPE
jgi:signal peptidase I